MASEKSPADAASGPEHRRSSRFPVVVPLEVNWREANGAQFKEQAHATEVNAHGALLQMRNYPTMGVEAELTNLLTAQNVRARMAAVRRSRSGAVQGIAIELLTPNESFWGLNFELRKASAELLRLEQGIKSGEIDPLILREFRDAVDYVRKTAWAVQEWRERQMQHRDPSTVLSLLTLERIRRATTLTHDLLGDLSAQDVSRRTEGIAELHDAVSVLHKRLTQYFEGGGTS
ncbi:MAG TPA: hypothetical protein VNF02_04095 [Candidatus Limnocylindrales bacterium]|nr:hypothetical protein [Candidatus Limnocylindrales bacterium]